MPLLLRGQRENGILLVFGKSYQDNTSNENSSQPIIIFIIYLLPRNFKYGIGLSLHIFILWFCKGSILCAYMLN